VRSDTQKYLSFELKKSGAKRGEKFSSEGNTPSGPKPFLIFLTAATATIVFRRSYFPSTLLGGAIAHRERGGFKQEKYNAEKQRNKRYPTQ
jgi:hypothetical protein